MCWLSVLVCPWARIYICRSTRGCVRIECVTVTCTRGRNRVSKISLYRQHKCIYTCLSKRAQESANRNLWLRFEVLQDSHAPKSMYVCWSVDRLMNACVSACERWFVKPVWAACHRTWYNQVKHGYVFRWKVKTAYPIEFTASVWSSSLSPSYQQPRDLD